MDTTHICTHTHIHPIHLPPHTYTVREELVHGTAGSSSNGTRAPGAAERGKELANPQQLRVAAVQV